MNRTNAIATDDECNYCSGTVVNNHGSLHCRNSGCITSRHDDRSWDDEDIAPFIVVEQNVGSDDYPFAITAYDGEGSKESFAPHEQTSLEFDFGEMDYEVWNSQQAVRG